MSSWRASKLTVGTLRVVNYRGFANFQLTGITPLTVLLGDNGSGKSTLLDVFSFVADCFRVGVPKAWVQRGGARHLKTKGAAGPVLIELGLRDREGSRSVTYRLAIDEEDSHAVVEDEQLTVRGSRGKPLTLLRTQRGHCVATPMNARGRLGRAKRVKLRSDDTICASVLGQLAPYPMAAALREFVLGWRHCELPLAPNPTTSNPFARRFDGSLELLDLPERSVHPRLHAHLAEALRAESERHQLFVATHSPMLVNAVRPGELVILERDSKGETRATQVLEAPHAIWAHASSRMWMRRPAKGLLGAAIHQGDF